MFHTPVLLKEALDFLNIHPGEKYVDATIGGGGHTGAILERGGVVLGIDVDPEAIDWVRGKFQSAISSQQLTVVQSTFKDIDSIARENGFEEVSGVIYDLGLSSWQIEKSGRGFSFLKDEPLDMRMDPSTGSGQVPPLSVRAEDLLAGLTEKELDELFSKFAQEKRSRAIVRALVCARRLRPLKTTQELCGLLAWVEKTLQERENLRSRSEEDKAKAFWDWYLDKFSKNPDKSGSYDLRARIFQALRIVVNDELCNLKISLPRAARLLKPQGRLVVISFHSLEDKIVKDFGKGGFSRRSLDEGGRPCAGAVGDKPQLRVLTKSPVQPSEEEIKKNPRARSARLRAFERIS